MSTASVLNSTPGNKPLLEFNWAVVAIIALATLPPVVGYFWTMGPGFGKRVDYFIPMTMVVLLVCFVSDVFLHRRLGLGIVFPVALFFNLAVTMGLTFTPALNDAMLAHGIHKKLQAAENNLPKAPVIAGEVLPLLVDRPTVRANRDRLIEIRDSRAEPALVTAYLADAEKFGVDAAFVRDNGMVRPQDKARLESRVKALAQQGHPHALVWLKANIPS